jgi:hypothetical protein
VQLVSILTVQLVLELSLSTSCKTCAAVRSELVLCSAYSYVSCVNMVVSSVNMVVSSVNMVVLRVQNMFVSSVICILSYEYVIYAKIPVSYEAAAWCQ